MTVLVPDDRMPFFKVLSRLFNEASLRLTAKLTNTLVVEWICWLYSVAVAEYYRECAMCLFISESLL